MIYDNADNRNVSWLLNWWQANKKVADFSYMFWRIFFRMKFADLSEKRLHKRCVIRCIFFVITCFILTKLWSMMVIILICYRMQYLVYHSDETNVHLLSPYMIKFKCICDSMTLFPLFCSILHCLKYLFLIF